MSAPAGAGFDGPAARRSTRKASQAAASTQPGSKTRAIPWSQQFDPGPVQDPARDSQGEGQGDQPERNAPLRVGQGAGQQQGREERPQHVYHRLLPGRIGSQGEDRRSREHEEPSAHPEGDGAGVAIPGQPPGDSAQRCEQQTEREIAHEASLSPAAIRLRRPTHWDGTSSGRSAGSGSAGSPDLRAGGRSPPVTRAPGCSAAPRRRGIPRSSRRPRGGPSAPRGGSPRSGRRG